ncbi:MAG: amino acid/amide ABC transporter substrate-binding protein HAAT family [bacterium]|nr:MAG: amino acid/amide ABC transporter substrate-binding protein HAAT family [bacterium]
MERKNTLVSMGIGVLVFVLAILMSVPSYAGEVRGVTGDTIKVGVVMDLTGPTATTQIPAKEAVVNYFRYISDQGGIHGRKIKLYIEDDRYSVPLDIAVFKKLVFRDKVFSIIFLISSPSARVLLPQMEKEKVPGTIIGLTEEVVIPTRRYMFMPVASYTDHVKVLFDYVMNDLKVKNPRMAYIGPDNEYGKTGYAAAQMSAEHYGIKIVDREFFSPGAVEAVSQVLLMKGAKPDFVISHNYVDNSIALLRDVRKMNFSIPFLGTSGSCTDDLVRIAGKAAENYTGTHPFNSWYSHTPGIAKMKEIHKKYSPGTEKESRTGYHIFAWVSAMTFAEAMKRAGKDLNPDSMVNALESFNNFDTGGLCAPITYGPDKHKGGNSTMLFKADVEKGRLISVGDWRKPSF